MTTIHLGKCPNCDGGTTALTTVGGITYCPACAPMPGRTQHTYRPITEAILKPLVKVTCCGDAGDCSHVCGVA